MPTPAKFHYVFNLRELSRIWQGMTSALPSVLTSKAILLDLWRHECCRVIADRYSHAYFFELVTYFNFVYSDWARCSKTTNVLRLNVLLLPVYSLFVFLCHIVSFFNIIIHIFIFIPLWQSYVDCRFANLIVLGYIPLTRGVCKREAPEGHTTILLTY